MTKTNRVFSWLVLSGLVFISGCGGSDIPPDRPKTVPVSGKVTYKGEAVPGATVTFNTKGGKHSAFALTQSDGTYKLRTFQEGDGAVPGDYVVTIVKVETPTSTGIALVGTPEYKPPVENAPPPAPPKSLIPAKYGVPETSGLAQTVKADGANTFDFALAD